MNPRVTITDRPRQLNLYNYEQRLRKLRSVFFLLLGELDEALDILEQQKKSDIKLIDELVKDA